MFSWFLLSTNYYHLCVCVLLCVSCIFFSECKLMREENHELSEREKITIHNMCVRSMTNGQFNVETRSLIRPYTSKFHTAIAFFLIFFSARWRDGKLFFFIISAFSFLYRTGIIRMNLTHGII